MIGAKPKIIVFFTSYKCNSRCVMCYSWQKQDRFPELSLGQIDRIFSDNNLSKHIEIVNITGGEPTLRKDLVDVIKIILERCKNLKRIDMPTNGIDTNMVLDKIEQILTLLLPTDVKFCVTLSLDGVGETHEKIRRITGAFDKAEKTIYEIREMTTLWKNLYFGINATISRLNYDRLDEIRKFGLKTGIGINYTLGAVSEIGVESIKMKDEFALRNGENSKVAEFIEGLLKEDGIDKFYAKFMLQYLKTGRRKPVCVFKAKKSFLLEPDGSAYLCGNFKDFHIGNLLKISFSEAWKNAGRLKRSIWKRCSTCSSNCYIDEVLRR